MGQHILSLSLAVRKLGNYDKVLDKLDYKDNYLLIILSVGSGI